MVARRCVVTSMCLSARSGDTKHLDPIGDGLRFFKKSRRCVSFVHIPKEGDVEMNALLQDLQVGKKKKTTCQDDFPLVTAVRRVLGND